MNGAKEQTILRAAIITSLAMRARAALGRTALMKLTFFLQILRGAPLNYSFRLCTYGPYDPQVLEDLKIAERLGGIRSETFERQGGSGYEIKPGEKAAEVISRAGEDIEELYEDWIGWLVSSRIEVLATWKLRVQLYMLIDHALMRRNRPSRPNC